MCSSETMAGIFEHENANDSSMTFPRFSATFLNVKNKFFENNFWPILDAANTFFYPKLKGSAENTHHWGKDRCTAGLQSV